MSSNIIINGNPIGDPQPSRDAANTNYIYIQGRERLTKDQKQQLSDLHVEIYEYVENNTYLCRYEPSDLNRIQELDFIAKANVYSRRLKTTPALDDALEIIDADNTLTVDIVLHKGPVTAEEAAQKLIQIDGINPDDISITHKKIRITTNAETIAKIKELDAVKEIEKVVPIKLYNNIARIDLDGNPVTIKSKTYEGSGQVVAVADTGFDKGYKKGDVHPAFAGRVIELYAIGRPGLTNDFQGHGTHCAGSVLGDGVSETMGGEIKGMAPKANLVVQSLLTKTGGLAVPPNLFELFKPPYDNNNARVASNSWGPDWELAGSEQLPYDQSADAIDSFVHNNPDHVIVFACGNDGQESSITNAHIGSSSAAKNCITVGATQSSRSNDGTMYVEGSKKPGNPSVLATFSSRGPTIERRIKPDVVAPGIAILSASSRDPRITTAMRNKFGHTKDELWMFDSGTSMATPLVAGCAAVIREALIAAGTERPSAALVKGLLINGAIDIGLPTTEQGFGRVDLINSLLPVETATNTQGYIDRGAWNASERLDEDDEWLQTIHLPQNIGHNKTLKVTLAYTDLQGAALQNNINLTVQIGQVLKRGDEGQSNENNVEQVIWKNIPAGTDVTIKVFADRLTRLHETQSFALVWRVI